MNNDSSNRKTHTMRYNAPGLMKYKIVLLPMVVFVGSVLVLSCWFSSFQPEAAGLPPAVFSEAKHNNVGKGPSGHFPESAQEPVQDESALFLERALALNAAANQNGGAASLERIRELLAEWAEKDPEGALSYALRPLDDDRINRVFFQAADTALAVWAGRDPTAARIFVEKHASVPQVAASLGPVMMRIYASADPQRALEWVQSGIQSDSDNLRPVLALELLSVLNKQGARGKIEKWLVAPQVAQSAYARESFEAYGQILAQENPQTAISFSKKLPRGSMARGVILQEAMQQWSSQNLIQAYDWIAKVEIVDESNDGSANAVEQPSRIPPGSYTSGELDYAIAGYAKALYKRSPSEARKAAETIEDRSVRERLLRQWKETPGRL